MHHSVFMCTYMEVAMESSVLHLDECLEQNYYALQNFLQEKTVERTRKSHSCSKQRNAKIKHIRAQDERCIDCGVHFPFINGTYPTATRDHVIPFRYGSTLNMNREFVCELCNLAREKNRIFHIKRFFGSIEEPV